MDIRTKTFDAYAAEMRCYNIERKQIHLFIILARAEHCLSNCSYLEYISASSEKQSEIIDKTPLNIVNLDKDVRFNNLTPLSGNLLSYHSIDNARET